MGQLKIVRTKNTQLNRIPTDEEILEFLLKCEGKSKKMETKIISLIYPSAENFFLGIGTPTKIDCCVYDADRYIWTTKIVRSSVEIKTHKLNKVVYQKGFRREDALATVQRTIYSLASDKEGIFILIYSNIEPEKYKGETFLSNTMRKQDRPAHNRSSVKDTPKTTLLKNRILRRFDYMDSIFNNEQ